MLNQTILQGDSLHKLKELKENSIGLMVTDPPYGYSFMNKDWDKAIIGVDTWRECLRVLKPGSWAYIMSAPRQDVLSHMIVNLSDAGFVTNFTSIYYCYASGFPKAMNIKTNISNLIVKKCQRFFENLLDVDFVPNSSLKQLTEVGIVIEKNNSVQWNVPLIQEIVDLNSHASIATKQFLDIQVKNNPIIIVVENAELSEKHLSLTVRIVENSKENQNLSNPQKIIVPINVLMQVCEQILDKHKDEEAWRTDSGKHSFLKNLDTNVFFVELTENLKHIILNQLKNILNLDTIKKMDYVFVTNVITMESIMVHLTIFMEDILRNQLKPVTEKYNGSYAGFQPKPALEVILVVMKPLDEKSYVEQAMSNGKGVTWFDDARIPFVDDNDVEKTKTGFEGKQTFDGSHYNGGKPSPNLLKHYNQNNQGRFPANVLVSDDALNDGIIRQGHSTGKTKHGFRKDGYIGNEEYYDDTTERGIFDSGSFSRYFDLDAWTAQFLIVEKGSKSEKNAGLELKGELEKFCDAEFDGIIPQTVTDGRKKDHNTPSHRGKTLRKNNHPTVKPISLMSYLITMGSREGDTILDPFAGSGTTLIAASLLNRHSIGIELNPEYCGIMKMRLDYWKNKTFEKLEKIKKQAEKQKIQSMEAFL